MHAVFSNLMASALFIHAVLGCCWHHAHVCVRCDGTSDGVSQPVACCKCRQGEGENRPGQQPDGPCKCRLECRGVCTFLPVQKMRIESSQLVVPFDFASILPALASSQAASARWAKLVGDPAELEAPLRLHLLHQILLI